MNTAIGNHKAMDSPKKSQTDRVSPSGLDRKVRVGVLIDSVTTSAWTYEMLDRIQASDYAEIVQVVENGGTGPQKKTGIARWQHIRKRLLYSLFSHLDRKLSRIKDDPLASKSLQPLLVGCRWLKVVPVRKGYVDRFNSADIEKMAVDNVDVYIRLGFGILKGDVLQAGRLGIWSYHHGDNRVNRGLPPGFWEIFNAESVTGLTLQVLGEELDAGQVLYRTISKTNNVYMHRSMCGLYWKSVAVIPRVLQKLSRLGIDEFAAEVVADNSEQSYYSKPLYTYPSNWQTALHTTQIAFRLMCHKMVELFFKEQWELMYKRGPSNSPRCSIWRYNEIRPPSDRFWADPFVLKVNGLHHLFFEELIFADNKGAIVHLSIDEEGNLSEPQIVLEKPYHLSYPFVFEYEGDHYMIPETAANRTVDLYKAKSFPNEWTHFKTLIEDVELVDATVVFHDNRWWMFAGQRDSAKVDISEELSVFYTDDLLHGDWISHPRNPVVSDVRCARPAGKITERNGTLYRPSQDCRNAYGGSIDIRKIEILTKENYKESHSSYLAPDWEDEFVGLHTLNRADELTVIDVVARRRRFFPRKR